ncbi:MAG TPA: DUF1285 domain-containing protein [Syntrophales bacterium]|nr:DUF1285 domain-containing protein [Syntrophales bacterium]HOX95142.1 DUF1285 domain-containing protein [Syntrophales bacterium]HPI55928.1 DUF1285 domain-containing protein [Syntrophales bacterium]HPN23581.1 DUF1285 domain-containing protein [Syntrophales bacterium]HQM27894.1 DUF1285 domain-containing protein [Syntrophales bacterium]
MTVKARNLSPSHIRIDKEGVWYYKGAEMFRREIVNLFYQNLHLDDLGTYYIEYENDIASLEVEDTAFVVRAVYRAGSVEGRDEKIYVVLSDDTCEELVPETLRVGRENVLYCAVKSKRFPARFLRASYYQLADYITEEEEGGDFFLALNGRKYYIRDQQP